MRCRVQSHYSPSSGRACGYSRHWPSHTDLEVLRAVASVVSLGRLRSWLFCHPHYTWLCCYHELIVISVQKVVYAHTRRSATAPLLSSVTCPLVFQCPIQSQNLTSYTWNLHLFGS